jgi:predicted site-specific integrase-resolvase
VNEKKLKASEIAEKFNVRPVTVRAWLKRGLFPTAILEDTLLGKVWLVPEKDLKNFLKPKRGRPYDKKE